MSQTTALIVVMFAAIVAFIGLSVVMTLPGQEDLGLGIIGVAVLLGFVALIRKKSG